MIRNMVIGVVLVCLITNKTVAQDARESNVASKIGRNQQLVFSGLYYSPGDDEIYGDGYGAELQHRFWNDSIGWAISAGGAYWEANEGHYDLGGGDTLDFRGNVIIFPVGFSVFLSPEFSERISLVVEAGLRYVIVQSNADAHFDYGFINFTEEVEIDNGVIGVAGIDLEVALSKSISLKGGVGVQADFVEGDVEIDGMKTGENELKASYARLGLAINF